MLRQQGGGAMSVGWSIWSPQTRWNGYFLWWYPKSQLVSLNPTILGYEGYPTMEIPPNPSPKSWVYDHCWMVWLPSGQGLAASDCWQCPSCATQPQRGQRMWVFGGHVGQGPRSQHSWWLHPLLVVIVEVFSPTSTICTTFMLRRGSWEGKSVSVCEFRYLSPL